MLIETPVFDVLAAPSALLGESPLWHPDEQVLYWCDIPGKALHRHDPARGTHQAWQFDCEPSCCAPVLGGGLLLAMRDGLWRFDTTNGQRKVLIDAPYDMARLRFNDGKADAQGRFWVGSIDEQRAPNAALYCYSQGRLQPMADGITVSNGLGFSPDGATLYWADTRDHLVMAFDLDPASGSLSRRRDFYRFVGRGADPYGDAYLGRPDGAAVDVEGCYWLAMFEGRCLLRLSPQGQLLRHIALPVQCATMPGFGGADLRTLYITTSRENRPDDELARDPLAGRVLSLRVDVAGLPANWVTL